ncbi:MAG: hypothetical protein JOZ47_10770 [Kutzneria sp.]|nr:hypothetical protein [Kutzneria sp.]MBV9845543.1 hypothetical protein [Kutzneria sp.]
MSVTRRTVLSGALGGALAAPFLAQFGGTAFGATPNATWGTVSSGWVELRYSSEALAQFDHLHAVVEHIAPATAITENGTTVGARFPIHSATGNPALTNLPQAEGNALLDGGVMVRAPMGQFTFTQLRPTLDNELASCTYTVNGVESSGQSLLRCGASQGRLLAHPVPAGQPLSIRIERVPVYPTTESLAAFASAFGTPTFTVDTVLAYLTAEAVYNPPRA